MKIPFVDLFAQYKSIQPEIDAAIADVIASSAFIRGPHVEAFEKNYAQVMGIPHCVSCANGTDAIYITLKALGIGPGDEVITTSHSWIATSETITQAGARVVFVDTERSTFNIDPALIEAKITPRTRAIIVVHLYGQPASMDEIRAIASRHNLWIIEDCAQAHFARYKDAYVGSMGIAGTFSFYPGKNLGAMGDAGCIVTANAELARKMAVYARHGGLKKGIHEIEGINSRLDGLQAAILNVKLKHILKWTSAKQEIAALYSRELKGVGDLVLPEIAPDRTHVFHLYVIRTRQREQLRQHLSQAGVDTVINYPIALPFLPAYRYLGHKPEDFPVSYENQSTILSLPIYPEMSAEQARYVIEQVKAFFS